LRPRPKQPCCRHTAQNTKKFAPPHVRPLRGAAMRELNVSKSSFDFGWIDAIETTGRHDWYEPQRRRLRVKG